MTTTLESIVAKYCGAEQMKKCTGCKEFWPADESFFFKASRNRGLQSQCRACVTEQAMARKQVRGIPDKAVANG